MKNILLIITLFISWNAFAVEKIWYCSPDAAAGLAYKNNKYEMQRFEVGRATIKQNGNMLTFPKGHPALPYPPAKCRNPSHKVIVCSSIGDFILNLESGHATSSQYIGRTIGDGEYKADMFVASWNCESF